VKPLESVCQLRYPGLRVIAVNDRSTDRTGELLESVRKKYAQLTILTVHELPQGWLGKNHALHEGYKSSSEEWMLFTDADVVFQKDTLLKAINYCHAYEVDHLVVLPDVCSRSKLLNSVLETFKLMLEIRLRPWDVSNPKSSASIGVGAFNLVKRDAYVAAGTHEAIAMRPDDDLKLGEMIKRHGYRQHALYGDGEISLEWYTSLKEFYNGLMKNSFAGFNYSVPMVLAAILGTFLFFVLPVPLLLIAGNGPEKTMALAILMFQSAMFLLRPGQRAKWWHVLMIPFAGLLMMAILFSAMIKTLRQGGIYWRESFYSLAELKKNK
jgi:cellulose synthase/poly-beta-1,6-N-acetylglucosamine synthase-like glycosyltransferase